MTNTFFMQRSCITTHNAQRTTHNAQRTTHNAQRTTHNAPNFCVFATIMQQHLRPN